jgi:xylan 1,4-beta-xylosidase
LLSNFDTPRSYLQKQGHGALVSTPGGEWYYASLSSRPWRHENDPANGVRGWNTLGRETSIQKIEWDEDGWPYVVGGHGGTRYVEAPKDAIPTQAPENHSQFDDFSSRRLSKDWNTLRVPFDEKMGSFDEGKLVLCGQGSLSNHFDLSLIARRWQAFEFEATTKVRFDPVNYMQMAGLTNYYNTDCWTWVFVTWDEKRQKRVIEVSQNDFGAYTSFLQDKAVVIPDGVEDIWLRTKVRTDYYTYLYSFDGDTWEELPVKLDAKLLSDDYIASRYGGFFTGAFVGLACSDLSGYRKSAAFSFFRYEER